METINTERLLLREWQETDSKDLFEYAKSEEVGPNAGWPPHKTEEESKEIIKMFRRNHDTYAVVLKAENKVIGSIGLHDRKPDDQLVNLKQKEMGYVLNPNYWGRGIIPEAVQALLEYGFTKLNVDLIWSGHFDFNQNSKRVNEKCGFHYRFQRKEKLKLLDNKEVTTLYYCLFKSDYVENKG
ncbi:ribosomal-protein-alanine acetyltransferase [Halalkalibacter wakoensis JCM 9140]|uniref:Ribosomal-protein-alanine acetyltransferase n=1 Tax=Halalkalibacter wakoensis JCM 9140 TaxID=1236970 RepID=W4Q0V8_9BACI|nr:GNAT family N-acetyltransferase [Halalkalibacter wakoensis]GAE25716.1 ribosomal-protein-alanine acetyltransferase [Halalkalibacter wakoensis JCM 9140]